MKAPRKSKTEYNPTEIEPKWQEVWEKEGLYQAEDFSGKPKYYVLIEFPYPSGAGLHVGHIRSWSAMDSYARKKRMEGYNVLYPIGWDAFGLPAENYAIKTGIHPSKAVAQNISNFKKQCKSLGLSFDWSREVNTTDPNYYKWTQWIFLKFFEKGLAYLSDVTVNWCPFCKTNLADEEVLANGTHERCGNPTERRMQKQWLLKITAYADRLIEDLKLVDYSPRIRIQQENWIGRKEGINITYPIDGTNEEVGCFTTRPDTNFGATFIVVAPEHPIVAKLLDGKFQISKDEIKKIGEYVKRAKNKSELDRISEGREKTGVFTGLYATNQLNSTKLPIWISDFVLGSVGTGAVVGVPGHDLRDFEFAQKFNLPVIRVVVGSDGDTSSIAEARQVQEKEGTMINSGFLNNMDINLAIEKIMDYLEEKGWGKRVVSYHLRDWVFSRQHYWGEPIPIIHCPSCGIVPVPEDQLPVELPYVEKYEPSGTGESPLANVKEWVEVSCPKCNKPARRETDTMPNWAGSNWYFLRYLDPENNNAIADKDKMEYWMPVDLYQGGFEHTTLHLLYSRFVYKFLFDIGVVPTSEPYAKRRSHGIVLGPDGRKMSKSFGNVINPDQVVGKFGADTLRLYEMFMGPFDQTVTWSIEGVEGCFRFLRRVWYLSHSKISRQKTTGNLLASLHRTIKKVSSDTEDLKFNTVVASLMEFVNSWQGSKNGLSKEDLRKFLLILAPFAPHMSEELWQHMESRSKNQESGKEKHDSLFIIHNSIHGQSWPKFDPALVEEEIVEIPVQVNGRLRGTLQIAKEEAGKQSAVESQAREDERVKKYLAGKNPQKIVFIPGRLINFVTS
ncbi:MAG: leucine--tRNA ligase [Candidatus Blackburnbacteria bacterium]|nr:leucine--tRNA ligase [Candidatus Blackburnbacteria bacterium]